MTKFWGNPWGDAMIFFSKPRSALATPRRRSGHCSVGKTGGRSVANLSKHATLRPPVRRFRPVDRAQDRGRDRFHTVCPRGFLRFPHSREPTHGPLPAVPRASFARGGNRLQAIICLRGCRTPACRTPLSAWEPNPCRQVAVALPVPGPEPVPARAMRRRIREAGKVWMKKGAGNKE